MSAKKKISLCVVGSMDKAMHLLKDGSELIEDVLFVDSTTQQDLKSVAQQARSPWIMFCYASESVDFAKLSQLHKELGKQKTWGYAIVVNYWEHAGNGVLAERRWEVRLVKKSLKSLTGFGLSLGYPGQEGTGFVEGVEIENPGRQTIAEDGESGPLPAFVRSYKQILLREPEDGLNNACRELLSARDISYFQAWAYCIAAEALLSAKETVEAEAILQEGIGKYPGCADLHLLFGNLSLEQGNPRQAVLCFQQALASGNGHYAGKRGANSFLAHHGLGRAFESLLDLSKSAEYFRQAYQTGFNEPLYNLARLYIQHLGMEAARGELENLVRTKGEMEPEILADVFYVNGCYEQALEYLEQVENTSNIAYFRGMICSRLGRWTEAVKAFARVEPGQELFVKSILQRVFCLWVQAKLKQAEQLLEKVAEVKDDEVRQYQIVHSLLRKPAKRDVPIIEASSDWEICLGILNRFLEVGQSRYAAKVSALLDAVPQPGVQLTLAKIYNLHREYTKVVDCLRFYKSLGEMNPDAYLYLARAYLESGQLAECFRTLNDQVLEGKATIETYLLAAQVLIRQTVWVLQTGSEQLQAPDLAEKAKQLLEVTNFRG